MSDVSEHLEENYLEIHAMYDDGSRSTAITKNITTGKYLLELFLDNPDVVSLTIFKTPQDAKILQE